MEILEEHIYEKGMFRKFNKKEKKINQKEKKNEEKYNMNICNILFFKINFNFFNKLIIVLSHQIFSNLFALNLIMTKFHLISNI